MAPWKAITQLGVTPIGGAVVLDEDRGDQGDDRGDRDGLDDQDDSGSRRAGPHPRPRRGEAG